MKPTGKVPFVVTLTGMRLGEVGGDFLPEDDLEDL